MGSEYVNPGIFNSGSGPDEFVFSSFLNGEEFEDPFFGDSIADYNPAIPPQQSYQNADSAAQQQLMNSIPAADISNVNYTAQLGNPYDDGNAFPFPLQEALQNVGTPNTAPSTARSPESSTHYNDSPFTNNTTSPEANPQSQKPAPKKRGRRPRVIKSKAEEDQLRQKFLERNRIAASKCREKKKDQTDKMQNDVHSLKAQNDALKYELQELRKQVRELKTIIEPHESSDCWKSSTNLAALSRMDQKKLATRREAATHELMDLDGMPFETECEVHIKEARNASVDSAVDLSTPPQPLGA